MAPKFQSGENNNLFLGAQKRRDIWPSAEEAYMFLKSRPTWKVWDDRILRIYVVCIVCLTFEVVGDPDSFFFSRNLGCVRCRRWSILIKRG